MRLQSPAQQWPGPEPGAVAVPPASAASHLSTPARPRRFSSSGARLCSKDARAQEASSASLRPSCSRQQRYSLSRLQPKSSGSSEFTLQATPARSSRGSGCSSRLATARSSALLVGQTSRQTPVAASCATNSGSSAARTPCAIRRAPRRSTQKRTLAGPPPGAGGSSPACGRGARSPAQATSKASWKGSGGWPTSAECRPKPTTPWRPSRAEAPLSAKRRTACASATASQGGRCRSAATMKPRPTPVASSAAAAARTSSPSVASTPPKRSA
mmetsp:Transcript_14080/g.44218  ORF Transcript_14080/g.44218 Transcript_14080/m.44218 type:complete len:271 (-) Transcript_14080:302-1114(-)